MKVPLFVELCAGTAALSLRLAHPRARPPVSRMGAKTGYADVILRCLGLYPGQGADHYLFCEPDPGVRLLLHAYRDRELATAAAGIIRSWKDEEPRALWERLRAEGPAVCPPVDPREVARWLFQIGGSHQGMGTGIFGGNLIGWEGTAHGQGPKRPLLARLPDALDPIPTLPATIADDARKVDPREVARWSFLHQGSFQYRGAAAGIGRPEGRDSGGGFGSVAPVVDMLPRLFAPLPTVPATIADDARKVDPPKLAPGVVVYIDPPYQGTTGYAHLFPRSEWLPVVRRWNDAGALVVVSEAEPIPELMADGWHAVRIDGERKGQKRTFSKQQAEWLTMSEPPKWRPSVQGQLFGRSQ